MQNLRNSVQLIGHLGADSELHNFDNGSSKATFSIATNEYYTKENGDREQKTEWHNVVAWGKSAEMVEKYFKKGKQVAIQGKLVHRSYETKDGQKRNVTEIKMNDFVLLGKKEELPF